MKILNTSRLFGWESNQATEETTAGYCKVKLASHLCRTSSMSGRAPSCRHSAAHASGLVCPGSQLGGAALTAQAAAAYGNSECGDALWSLEFAWASSVPPSCSLRAWRLCTQHSQQSNFAAYNTFSHKSHKKIHTESHTPTVPWSFAYTLYFYYSDFSIQSHFQFWCNPFPNKETWKTITRYENTENRSK